MSSGMTGLLSSVAFFIAAAGGLAYGLHNKDQVRRFVTEVTGVEMSPRLGGGTAAVSARARDADGAGSNGDVKLRATNSGHFETTAEINGREVDVMVDTGATLVALTYEDAERAGIYLRPADYTHQVSTANGVAKVAPVTIDSISIGNITVRNVRGAVAERGKMTRTLLGMTFLGRLSRVEMQRDALILHE